MMDAINMASEKQRTSAVKGDLPLQRLPDGSAGTTLFRGSEAEA